MTNSVDDLSRRGFLGRTAALGLAATASGLLLPEGAAVAQEPQRGGHLKLGLNGGATTDSLDTATYSGAVLFVIGRTWGDTLVETDPATGAALPALAESWSSTPQADVWTFKLRKGVKFHDGKEMTVGDAVQTIKRHTDEGTKSGALGMLRSIKAVEDQGGDLVVTLTEGNADLPLILSDYHLIVQPNGGFDKPDAAIGTGPYKLTSYQAGVRATFEKNADDWRDDRGFVDSVELIVMNDTTARIAALSSGQVHFINAVEPKTVKLIERAPTVTILRTAGKGFYCFLAHCDTAPFDNNDLRLALKYAIDRQAILDRILGGYGTLGNDYPVNANYALAPEGIEQRAYDPEKAAFHYKKSGHSGPILLRTAEAAVPGRGRRGGALPGERQGRGHRHRGEARARRRLLDQRLERAALLRLLLGRAADAGPALYHLLRLDRRVERHPLQARGLRRADRQGPLGARPGQAQGALRGRRDHGARRGRDHPAGVQRLPERLDEGPSMGFVDDIGNDTSNGYVASRVWLAG